jgi:RNA polymerase sigma-70 factor (ECF subfamily)
MDKENRFRTIVEENKDRIWRVCCCYVANEDERKDVYQDVLGNLWRNLDTFEGRSEISTWVYRVATNTCFGFLRSERTRKKWVNGISQAGEMDIPDRSSEEGQASDEEDVRRLYESIGKLRPVDRTLVSLYLEELTTREISEILGISEVNVRVKMHRIKRELKKMLEEAGYGLE